MCDKDAMCQVCENVEHMFVGLFDFCVCPDACYGNVCEQHG